MTLRSSAATPNSPACASRRPSAGGRGRDAARHRGAGARQERAAGRGRRGRGGLRRAAHDRHRGRVRAPVREPAPAAAAAAVTRGRAPRAPARGARFGARARRVGARGRVRGVRRRRLAARPLQRAPPATARRRRRPVGGHELARRARVRRAPAGGGPGGVDRGRALTGRPGGTARGAGAGAAARAAGARRRTRARRPACAAAARSGGPGPDRRAGRKACRSPSSSWPRSGSHNRNWPAMSSSGCSASASNALSGAAAMAALVAALEDPDAADAILLAAAGLGATTAAWEEGERASVLRLQTGRIEFEHPLLRAAVLGRASAASTRAAHAALADALRDEPHRAAWHRAAAAVGPDEEIAAALERTADEQRRRAGHAGAARALERAARLSPAACERARRLDPRRRERAPRRARRLGGRARRRGARPRGRPGVAVARRTAAARTSRRGAAQRPRRSGATCASPSRREPELGAVALGYAAAVAVVAGDSKAALDAALRARRMPAAQLSEADARVRPGVVGQRARAARRQRPCADAARRDGAVVRTPGGPHRRRARGRGADVARRLRRACECCSTT